MAAFGDTLNMLLLDSLENQTYYYVPNDTFAFNASSSFNEDLIPFWINDPCKAFQFVLCSVVIGSVSLMGLFLNSLSFYVLHMDANNEVATFLLKSLAVADNSVLIVSLIILSAVVGPIQIPSTLPTFIYVVAYMKKYVNPFGYITQCCSIWITVLLAVNRFIAVCYPFAITRWLTLNKARIQVAVVVVCSVAFNIPRFLQYNVVWKSNDNITYVPKKELSALGNNAMFELVYFNIFYTAVILVVPIIATIIFDIVLFRELRRSRLNMERNSVTYLGRQERNITRVALIIVLELIFCHVPDRVLTVLKLIHADQTDCPYALLYLSHIANFLIIINSSTDFFIYVIFRKRFRKLLFEKCKCICCCCARFLGKRQASLARESSGNSGNYGLLHSPSTTENGTSNSYFTYPQRSMSFDDRESEHHEMISHGNSLK